MDPEEILRTYIPLVDFLAEVLGPDCEVVLHDLRDMGHSIVAIRNGQLSGRQVGDSVTDYALEVLREHGHRGEPYRANYYGRLEGSDRLLRLSTYFVRDREGQVVGMLSINMDLSLLTEAHRALGRLLGLGIPGGPPSDQPLPTDPSAAHINLSIENLMHIQLEQAIRRRAVEPGRMTMEEKRRIVEELDGKGIFLLKGSVAEVARRLEVSEQTIYRYLRSQ
jgi:predicted transcriptional regulator YheO